MLQEPGVNSVSMVHPDVRAVGEAAIGGFGSESCEKGFHENCFESLLALSWRLRGMLPTLCVGAMR